MSGFSPGVQGNQPATVPIEYTRGTGVFYPVSSSAASVSAIIDPGTETTLGSSVSVTPGSDPGQQNISVLVGSGIGTAFPTAPTDGQFFYRTDLSHLYVYSVNDATWHQA